MRADTDPTDRWPRVLALALLPIGCARGLREAPPVNLNRSTTWALPAGTVGIKMYPGRFDLKEAAWRFTRCESLGLPADKRYKQRSVKSGEHRRATVG